MRLTRMARIIAIANQKGGVGKTTTAVNLAASLAAAPKRVLLVDLDSQGNATMGSGVDKREVAASTCDLLLGEATAVEVRVTTPEGFDLLPGNIDLTAAEIQLMDQSEREQRLKRALAPVRDEYDFILIDCPPSLNLLTLNGLCAAHGVIVPMQCEYFALEGLTDLVNTIKQVHANLNKNLQIVNLVRVMFDPRITLQQQVSEQLKSHFGDKVFDTVIPRNVRLAEAPSYGLPGVVFDPSARGSQAFVAFASELVEKMPPASMFAPLSTATAGRSAKTSKADKAGKDAVSGQGGDADTDPAGGPAATTAARKPAASTPESV
jgi:chromosome partitioning protein